VKNILFSIALLVVAACGGKSTPPTEPEPGPGTSASGGGGGGEDCGVPAGAPPSNAEQCECMGHTVVGDIGDGQVACPEGTTEIARIQYGIEGGVCCSTTAAAPAPTAE
jgi:hypothetical protein